ncbi:gluconokinase [Gellertiella hungarica]|uniref:Gluconokinase n=1 Tax=Gellertiella hungarica TaxID=1572859 RepID=A0A7W6JA05_9HYPH|nr:gluconokinase [Gellertiella hungarica]MBB4066632.1 gluconokinase [Gellertiella hungarica]
MKYVIMGVSGSGKSSVGEALSAAMDVPYADGDDLHPAENIARMSAGIPLTDEDRWPWLRAVGEALRAHAGDMIIGCSALKRRYRDCIRQAAGEPVTFIHLDGPRGLIEARMQDRRGHFMPASLLDSQFAALERPDADEDAVTVSIDQPVEGIVADILISLAARKG